MVKDERLHGEVLSQSAKNPQSYHSPENYWPKLNAQTPYKLRNTVLHQPKQEFISKTLSEEQIELKIGKNINQNNPQDSKINKDTKMEPPENFFTNVNLYVV